MNGSSSEAHRRILVADDSEAIHQDFRKILAPPSSTRAQLAASETALFGNPAPRPCSTRFQIDSAYHGEAALALVKAALDEGKPYAMAFIDVRMPPGWDGLETTQKVLAVDPRLQIVFCTAHSDYSWEEMFEKIDRHDGIVVLKKPFDTMEATQLAHAMTEKWRLHRESEQKMEDLERLVSERTCQLQRTEKLYRGAIAGADAIPYALDYKSRRYIFMGGRIKQLIGYAPEEMTGEIWTQIVQESVMLGEAAGLTRLEAREQAQEGKFRNWRCDMRVLTRSGETRWISDASVVELDEFGCPISCMGILQDITERRTLEQRFLRAQRMENIGTLAGGIAHDINNVLAPIIMAAGLLQKAGQDEGSHHLLSTIESSAQRGADMVRQILSFARGVDSDRERIRMADLLRDIEKIGNDTFLKNVEFRSSIPSGLWTVLGDATQLHQVLLNLCVNARDSMPHGGILTLSAENIRLNQLTVGQNPDAKPGPYTVCTIKDTGTGIPPEALDKIFEPFFTTKDRVKGTGLGLSTSLSIVKSHGGFITVYSMPGSGSEFSVYLPATEGSNIEATPSPVVSPTASIPRGNGELVLVVDDEEHVRQMSQHVLESLGYQVELAPDGDCALSIYSDRQTEIDVLLTDIMMPGMDGCELIQAVLNINPHARIIASSGVHASAEKLESLALGGVRFLPKPYAVEALSQTLLTVLSEREPMSSPTQFR